MKKIAIIGWEEGTAGQIYSWLGKLKNYEIVCFVHPYGDFPIIDEHIALSRPASTFSFPKNGKYLDKPLIFGENWIQQLYSLKIDDVVLTISDIQERVKISNLLKVSNFPMESIIHPTAVVLDESSIGLGNIIEPFVFIGYRSEIKNFVHIHVRSSINHHSVIESYVNIFPSCTIAGNSLIQSYSTLYTGTIVVNRINLATHTIVGAGSTVLKSVDKNNQTIVGSPAAPK